MDEVSSFGFRIFDGAGIGDPKERRWLLQESAELLAIFTSTGKTGKSRR